MTTLASSRAPSPAADARRVRFASALAVAAAAVLAGILTPLVLATLAEAEAGATLARALPTAASSLITRFAEAPLLVAGFVALLPLVLWVSARLTGALADADALAVHRGLAFAWTVSVCASAAAILVPPADIKQGLAALGYALAWPALFSLAAALWPSRLPRVVAHGVLLLATLAGLVARALPIGWPGEHSLTWWAMLRAAPPGVLVTSLGCVAAATAITLAVLMKRSPLPAAVSLAMLALASLLLLRGLPGFEHYAHSKHAAALASEINTSYLQAASRPGDVRALVRGYVEAMATLPMHARTHSPAWPLAFRAAVALGSTPAGERKALVVARLAGAEPREAAELAASVAERPLLIGETSGLWLLVGLLALAVAALPAAVWFAARGVASPRAASRAAALAVLLPAPLVYFPDVDVLYPVLYALVAGAWLRRGRGAGWALFAGVVLAGLVALSFGNLGLLLLLAGIVVLGWRGTRASPRREMRAAALALLPLALLVAVASLAGARPLDMLVEALAQHGAILAHRTRALWMALHPFEVAVGLGFPLVLALARGLDWRSLEARVRARACEGGELLLAAALGSVLLLDLSGTSKGEAARLWMGWFPLLLAGGVATLDTREHGGGWGWLAVGLAATLVVLKGFYVFVWLYRLA